MRTTLTLDEDLGRRLKELARESGRSFREVVNEVVRRGLSTGERPPDEVEPFRVVPKACGFKPGIDPLKLNQLYDDLEIERLGTGGGFGVHEP
ncbi:MAG TPA: CopG family transcriptional regulator [Candidatus Sulfomarinibacteraceae bacterium]|nr:CopG family transcriptional regulator [Methylomirabilota bacterium]HSN56326.1 CopG family transcriptional regulator [Candidatus Sulfomarinibacteraceae bacterium]